MTARRRRQDVLSFHFDELDRLLSRIELPLLRQLGCVREFVVRTFVQWRVLHEAAIGRLVHSMSRDISILTRITVSYRLKLVE